MPELPEVEILARHLDPLLRGLQIEAVQVLLPKLARPNTPSEVQSALVGRVLRGVRRRAKFLLFDLEPVDGLPTLATGHLGMTGRMYLQAAGLPPPKHTAVLLSLGARDFVFEDCRRFGRFNLEVDRLLDLGPEPWDPAFSVERFRGDLQRSSQPIKVQLLDQSLVAGLGNIYASEALFRSGISPRKSARRLGRTEVARLQTAIRAVLESAIQRGSAPVDSAKTGTPPIFYHSRGAPRELPGERFQVYDRAGEPCFQCGTTIRRQVQAGRSSYWCPQCQK